MHLTLKIGFAATVFMTVALINVSSASTTIFPRNIPNQIGVFLANRPSEIRCVSWALSGGGLRTDCEGTLSFLSSLFAAKGKRLENPDDRADALSQILDPYFKEMKNGRE